MLVAVTLITLGVLFLLNNLYEGLGFERTWPVLLVVIGLVKVVEYLTRSIGGSDERRNPDVDSDRAEVR